VRALAPILFLTILAPAALPQDTRPAPAEIRVAVGTEEGKQVLIATVMNDGKPVAGASVKFSVARLFGQLSLGIGETLDDGTAAVPFPEDLPGGATGELDVTAAIQSPKELVGVRVNTKIPGGAVVPSTANAFPEELWSPRAPRPLVITIVLLVASAWIVYVGVVARLLKIRNEASHERPAIH
jgi:hypothetical protein